MAKEKEDPELAAHQTIYNSLKGLDPQQQDKVLKSVLALLGVNSATLQKESAQEGAKSSAVSNVTQTVSSSVRPLSLIELMNDKRPSTNLQKIVLFAYYREKYESKARFSRDDLEPYFSKAKLPPPANYGRDFNKTVKKGWIHEDGAESYITTKGIEAVESAFAGQDKSVRKPKPKAARKKAASKHK